MMKEKFEDAIKRISREEFDAFYQIHNQQATVDHFGISWGTLKKLIKHYQIEKSVEAIRKCASSTYTSGTAGKKAHMEQLMAKVSLEEIERYYNVENHSQHECAEHFGLLDSEFIRLLKHYGISKNQEAHVLRIRKSKEINHGDPNYNNREKAQQTCLEQYGVSNLFKDREWVQQT